MSLDLSPCRKFTDCKICTISEWNIPLFLRVHQMALKESYEYGPLSKWVNTEIQRSNAISPPSEQREWITQQQMQHHMISHVPVEEMRRAKSPPARNAAPLDPVVERKLQELAGHAAACGVEDLDDFHRFHETLSRMEKRFSSLDKLFDGGELPDKDLLNAYRSFGDSVTRMFAESIKMRQQEKILQNAIVSTLDTMAMNSLGSILKSVERLMVDVRPLLSEPEKADELTKAFRECVASSLRASAKTAIEHLKSTLRVA